MKKGKQGMRNLMYLFILSAALGACSSNKTMSRGWGKKHPVTSASRVPDEPDYQKDQRLNKYTYETTEDSNSGASGPGTGASYGGFSSRGSSLKRDYEDRMANRHQVRPGAEQPADE